MLRNPLFLFLGLLLACGSALANDSADELGPGEANVSGTIKGTEVRLAKAEYDGQLAIFMGDNWASGPSLLIFFFDDAEGVKTGIAVDADESWSSGKPHVHYRWRNADGEVESEALSSDFNFSITTGPISEGGLSGKLSFSVPREETQVSGSFRAKVAEE